MAEQARVARAEQVLVSVSGEAATAVATARAQQLRATEAASEMQIVATRSSEMLRHELLACKAEMAMRAEQLEQWRITASAHLEEVRSSHRREQEEVVQQFRLELQAFREQAVTETARLRQEDAAFSPRARGPGGCSEGGS